MRHLRDLLQGRLAVLAGWPRRVAAVLCLLLAAASAVSGPAASEVARPSTSLASQLDSDEVIVPVTLAIRADFLHPGDHVDLLAAVPDSPSASSLGTHLLVVRVSQPARDAFATDGGTGLLVAADRSVAARIAAVPVGQIMAVLGKDP